MTRQSKKNGHQFQLQWPELVRGTLVKRYKRFLADIALENGKTVTAHCANSGTMLECALPGQPVYISYDDNPKRKLKYTWQMIEMPTSLVGVNTMIPNRLVAGAVENGDVRELTDYENVRREVTVGEGSRLDLALFAKGKPLCYVEIKNCTLVQEQVARFPDAVTTRGKKHLLKMEQLLAEGARCVMFYLVQRMDADSFKPADDIDPAYGDALRRVADRGLEILVYDVVIDTTGIRLNRNLPYRLT